MSSGTQEITAIFGSIPDFIVDQWVKDVLNDKAWDNNTVLQIIADRAQNPFTMRETTEFLTSDWEDSAEVRSRNVLHQGFLSGWKKPGLVTSDL